MSKAVILCVDDEKMIRDFVQKNLEVRGFRVVVASHGVEALEIFNSKNIDLVILDIMMPRMSGYEVCQHLKSADVTRDIPVDWPLLQRLTQPTLAAMPGGNDALAELARLDGFPVRSFAILEIMGRRGRTETRLLSVETVEVPRSRFQPPEDYGPSTAGAAATRPSRSRRRRRRQLLAVEVAQDRLHRHPAHAVGELDRVRVDLAEEHLELGVEVVQVVDHECFGHRRQPGGDSRRCRPRTPPSWSSECSE